MCHAESGGKEEDGSGSTTQKTQGPTGIRLVHKSKMSVYFDANHERAR